jgi:hypothetical protein
MKRALLSFAVLISGCASQQPFFPPGSSPDELISTIGKEGRGEGPSNVPPQPQPGGLLAPNASSSPTLATPAVNASMIGR